MWRAVRRGPHLISTTLIPIGVPRAPGQPEQWLTTPQLWMIPALQLSMHQAEKAQHNVESYMCKRACAPLYCTDAKCLNKLADQAAGSSHFLSACYKLAFGLNGAGDALKVGTPSTAQPDLLQEQTFKMRINFGAEGGTEEEEQQWNPLPLCAENRHVIKRRRKTGIMLTQTHTHEKPWHASAQSAILMCGSKRE